MDQKPIFANFNMYARLLSTAFQTLVGYICLDLCVSISLHYVAIYDGTIANAGLGLAYTCVSILLTPFGFGFNQSLNLHAAQALGNQKVKLAKRYLTVNIYILILSLIPLSGILYALKYPLSLSIPDTTDDNGVNEREGTADAAWEYLLFMLPANILALQFEGIKTFMIAYKITYPFTIIHLITTSAHWFMSWLFIAHLGMGIRGAGMAVLLTETLNIIGLLIFVLSTDLKTTVFADVNWFYNFKKYNKLALSYLKSSFGVVLHLYSEFFVFFCLSFFALSLGTASMNAHLAVQNTTGIIFRFPICLSLALMSYVGTEMGNGNVAKSRQYTQAALVLFFVISFMILGALWILKEQWMDFYSEDPEVRQLMSDLFIWMNAGITFINGFQGLLTGVLKGIDKIPLVTYSTIIAYYVICLPLVVVFTYSWGLDQGVVGIWQAFAIANVLLVITYVVALLITDWNKQSSIIRTRVQQQNKLHGSQVEVHDIKASLMQ